MPRSYPIQRNFKKSRQGVTVVARFGGVEGAMDVVQQLGEFNGGLRNRRVVLSSCGLG